MKRAVIIKGNPKFVQFYDISEKFYNHIKELLEFRGYSVIFDAGEEYTLPPDADVWIAHSRGMSRLRFASSSTKTIRIDDYLPIGHCELDGTPNISHYLVSNELIEVINVL